MRYMIVMGPTVDTVSAACAEIEAPPVALRARPTGLQEGVEHAGGAEATGTRLTAGLGRRDGSRRARG